MATVVSSGTLVSRPAAMIGNSVVFSLISTPETPSTLRGRNTDIDLDLDNVPQLEDSVAYKALLDVHEAVEILADQQEERIVVVESDAVDLIAVAVAGMIEDTDSIELIGEVTGGPKNFKKNGNVAVPTIINLPNITRIDGGQADSSYPGEDAGPYGVFASGISTAGSEYCPGYTYTFINTTQWKIIGLDVSNLFFTGRRLKFVDSETELFGIITSVTFTTDTTISMSMEDSTVLTNTITEVCLVQGTAGWSPLAINPFSNDSINDLCVGDIATVTYLFAVGNLGKVGVSSDGGLTWFMLSTGTTEHLTACVYDSVNETFWAGGDAGVLVSTINGTSIILDTTSIPALTAASGNGNINGFAYNSGEDGLVLLFHGNGTPTWFTASSADQGATWTTRASLGNINAGFPNLKSHGGPSNTELTGNSIDAIIINSSGTRLLTSGFEDTTFQTGNSIPPSVCSYAGHFRESGLATQILGGFDGAIESVQGQWTARDDVTFSQRIRAFAYSPIHERLVCVGDNQQIGYLDRVDRVIDDAWTAISNGFNPTANINAVVWDDIHGLFIAVADNGQICRSTNGIN